MSSSSSSSSSIRLVSEKTRQRQESAALTLQKNDQNKPFTQLSYDQGNVSIKGILFLLTLTQELKNAEKEDESNGDGP